jgi:ribosomal protein S18 acetylase RimI-like enzyme
MPAAPEQVPPAFTLPAILLSQGFGLRPETDADIAFLLRLYASTREQELAQVPWSTAQKQTFLVSQFEAQRRHYRSYFGDSAFGVIERNGEPAGRLYLQVRETQLHIIDIALLPAWRGRGIGTAILEASQGAGRSSGKGVGIMVEKFNPALRLYRRLGFAAIADHGVYLELEWLPEPDSLSGAAGGAVRVSRGMNAAAPSTPDRPLSTDRLDHRSRWVEGDPGRR